MGKGREFQSRAITLLSKHWILFCKDRNFLNFYMRCGLYIYNQRKLFLNIWENQILAQDNFQDANHFKMKINA